MWYLILPLSSIVAGANRYSEKCFLQSRERGTGDEYMEPRGLWIKNIWEPSLYSVDNWMINEYEAVGGTIIGRGNRRIRIKPPPVLLSPTKIPHVLI
jgi:hypothetical protein